MKLGNFPLSAIDYKNHETAIVSLCELVAEVQRVLGMYLEEDINAREAAHACMVILNGRLADEAQEAMGEAFTESLLQALTAKGLHGTLKIRKKDAD